MNITLIKATVHERETTLELTAEIGITEDPIEAAQTLLIIAKTAVTEPELGLSGLDLAGETETVVIPAMFGSELYAERKAPRA